MPPTRQIVASRLYRDAYFLYVLRGFYNASPEEIYAVRSQCQAARLAPAYTYDESTGVLTFLADVSSDRSYVEEELIRVQDPVCCSTEEPFAPKYVRTHVPFNLERHRYGAAWALHG
tara:strand:- start:570 stop:920 length:351 start_codon:yes stop_codon:yes gene_type:complete